MRYFLSYGEMFSPIVKGKAPLLHIIDAKSDAKALALAKEYLETIPGDAIAPPATWPVAIDKLVNPTGVHDRHRRIFETYSRTKGEIVKALRRVAHKK